MKTTVITIVLLLTSSCYGQYIHIHSSAPRLHPAHYNSAPVARFNNTTSKQNRARRIAEYQKKPKEVLVATPAKELLRREPPLRVKDIPALDSSPRTWKSKDGEYTIHAWLMKTNKGLSSTYSIVYLKKTRNRKIVKVAKSDLSELDQEYIKGLLKGWVFGRRFETGGRAR